MQIGLGISLTGLRRRAERIITAIIRPALGPLVGGDAIEDALSADIGEVSNYASSEGAITSVTVTATVNGDPADLTDTVSFEDAVVVTVTVQDDASNERVFTLSRVVPEADPDAAAYIAAVEAEDGEALEPAIAAAYDDFVRGCKEDEIWDAIKASCIMAGARTLSGALVPLAGPAPTNFNFVPGDYDRVTGLQSDGETKYLNTNRNNNADPQNSKHLSVFAGEQISLPGVQSAFLIASFRGPLSDSLSQIAINSTSSSSSVSDQTFLRLNQDSGFILEESFQQGFLGVSRPSATEFTVRQEGSSSVIPAESSAPSEADTWVFDREFGGTNTPARLSFYSIGEAVDLAALDARVTALMAAIEDALT